ncbi:zinc ribbon domain-containing protein [Streptomyces sp. NPDC047009]|uniref:zinc ribbon domain-containing protein n=1 Tax=unclassified Streptomyces TaxID=2593676 RepID=UPI0033E7D5EA
MEVEACDTSRLPVHYRHPVVEDLNVAGMLRNRRLARKIADAGFGEIRRQLTYKSRRNACRIVVADRWFPSSKTCSACGAVKAELPLHARIFDCAVCPLVKDRDENAARNLAALAAMAVTGTGVAADQGASAPKPRGADQKTRTPVPATRRGRGGQVAQPCRTSGRQKRETVLKPKPSRLVM